MSQFSFSFFVLSSFVNQCREPDLNKLFIRKDHHIDCSNNDWSIIHTKMKNTTRLSSFQLTFVNRTIDQSPTAVRFVLVDAEFPRLCEFHSLGSTVESFHSSTEKSSSRVFGTWFPSKTFLFINYFKTHRNQIRRQSNLLAAAASSSVVRFPLNRIVGLSVSTSTKRQSIDGKEFRSNRFIGRQQPTKSTPEWAKQNSFRWSMSIQLISIEKEENFVFMKQQTNIYRSN